MNPIPELLTIALTIAWMVETIRNQAQAKQELLAQKTLELIASDRARTRAGVYNVRSN